MTMSLFSTVSSVALQVITVYPLVSNLRMQKLSCSRSCLLLSCWRSDFYFEIKTNVVFIFVLYICCFAVDITLYRNGYHGDLNETFFVGDVDEGARKLVQTTYECLMQAIDAGQHQCWHPLELLLLWWASDGSCCIPCPCQFCLYPPWVSFRF